jgi:hypothetical protein
LLAGAALFPTDAIHGQQALAGILVAEALDAPHEFAPCKPQLVNKWMRHSVYPLTGDCFSKTRNDRRKQKIAARAAGARNDI